MAIMTTQGQGDSRGSAWVLASAALESLEDANSVVIHRVEINNAFRLLKAFDGNAYFSTPQLSIYPGQHRGASRSASGRQDDLEDVEIAIRNAIQKVFHGTDPSAAIGTVTSVLAAIYKDRLVDVQASDVLLVKDFFAELKNDLSVL